MLAEGMHSLADGVEGQKNLLKSHITNTLQMH